MARLPGGDWFVQQVDGEVFVFRGEPRMVGDLAQDDVIVRYDNSDANATARAQKTIHDSERLTDEQKCFAHFWCGYFHAYG